MSREDKVRCIHATRFTFVLALAQSAFLYSNEVNAAVVTVDFDHSIDFVSKAHGNCDQYYGPISTQGYTISTKNTVTDELGGTDFSLLKTCRPFAWDYRTNGSRSALINYYSTPIAIFPNNPETTTFAVSSLEAAGQSVFDAVENAKFIYVSGTKKDGEIINVTFKLEREITTPNNRPFQYFLFPDSFSELIKLSLTSKPFSIHGAFSSFFLDNIVVDTQFNQVPEPATLALFVFGLVGLGLVRRRKAVDG